MNYAIVAIGGLLALIAISWFAFGRHHYHGPVSTVDEFVEGDSYGDDKKEA